MSILAESTRPSVLRGKGVESEGQREEDGNGMDVAFGIPKLSLGTVMQLWTSIAYMVNYVVLPGLPHVLG